MSSFLSKEAKLTMRCSSTCPSGRSVRRDFIMPYLGAPFVERATFRGMLDALDIVLQRIRSICSMATSRSRGISPPPRCWRRLKIDLIWLREQVLTATRRGDERGAIHQAN